MGFRLANIDRRAALTRDGTYFDLAEISGRSELADPMAAISESALLHELSSELEGREPTGRLLDIVLGPPVPRPRNSFAVGLNYASHVKEAEMAGPEVPLVFTKFPSCITGPTSPIDLRTDSGDYEAELVVVIGSEGRDIETAEAWGHVAGVMVGQDISDRALQFAARPPHFDLGKSRDTYGPTGPVMVSADLLADPNSLMITCEVNGEVRQSDTTGSMIFDVPTLVSYISGIVTLAPGDLIFTGTPAGIGMASGRFLARGDIVITTIEGIGTLTNHCR